MPSRYQVNPELLVECALRMKVLGRKGAELAGRTYTVEELRRTTYPDFPLVQFSEYEYYMRKDGSGGQSRY